MNRKPVWFNCHKCGMGFRHSKTREEAVQNLRTHRKNCKGKK